MEHIPRLRYHNNGFLHSTLIAVAHRDRLLVDPMGRSSVRVEGNTVQFGRKMEMGGSTTCIAGICHVFAKSQASAITRRIAGIAQMEIPGFQAAAMVNDDVITTIYNLIINPVSFPS